MKTSVQMVVYAAFVAAAFVLTVPNLFGDSVPDCNMRNKGDATACAKGIPNCTGMGPYGDAPTTGKDAMSHLSYCGVNRVNLLPCGHGAGVMYFDVDGILCNKN